MTRNERRFGVIGTIGNCSDLIAAPKLKPTHSYHIRQRQDGEPAKEMAIRYDRELAIDCAARIDCAAEIRTIVTVVKKPILTEAA